MYIPKTNTQDYFQTLYFSKQVDTWGNAKHVVTILLEISAETPHDLIVEIHYFCGIFRTIRTSNKSNFVYRFTHFDSHLKMKRKTGETILWLYWIWKSMAVKQTYRNLLKNNFTWPRLQIKNTANKFWIKHCIIVFTYLFTNQP